MLLLLIVRRTAPPLPEPPSLMQLPKEPST